MKEIATDILQLRFSHPEDLKYEAGQFVQIIVPDNSKEVLRSYSISSAPEDNYIEFCVKYLEDGKASNYFKKMNIGDNMRFRGPLGRFVFKDKDQGHHFIATGTGIAPIIGIIRSRLEYNNETRNIHLLFGVRYEQDIFWKEKLDDLKYKYTNFDYNLILSRPLDTWSGMSGHVTEHVIPKEIKDHYYICGNGGMVKDVRTLLINSGVNLKNISLEIF